MNEERRISAVLFDAGGTLIHLDGERICEAAGVPYGLEDFRRAEAAAVTHVGRWVRENPRSTDANRLPVFLDAVLAALGLTDPAERGVRGRRLAEEHARMNLWSAPVEGAQETLRTLRDRGYRLGVVSNADGRVRALLEIAGLLPLLDDVVDSSEVGLEKPDPAIFRMAARRLGVPPELCAFVGDIYEIDVLGARAAGLFPILIGDRPAPEPVTRIEALQEVLPLFPSLRPRDEIIA